MAGQAAATNTNWRNQTPWGFLAPAWVGILRNTSPKRDVPGDFVCNVGKKSLVRHEESVGMASIYARRYSHQHGIQYPDFVLSDERDARQ